MNHKTEDSEGRNADENGGGAAETGR